MAASEGLRAAVLGASGYVGGELLRILAGHPSVAELRGFSASAAGRRFAEVHPALLHLPMGSFEPPDPAAAARWADAVFLALPHGSSQRMVGELGGARLVVDTAADFRIRDRELYEAAYGPRLDPDAAAAFAYGLADVLGSELAGARRIASPGCFATAVLLGLRPFAARGTLAAPPVAVAATGSSGSGAEPRPTTHHPFRAHNLYAYSVSGHRHEAEIAERLRVWSGDPAARCTLLTHSAPLVRGIHVTLHLRPPAPLPEPGAALAAAYAGRPFVRCLERPPQVAAVAGTNFAHLHAVARDGGREVIVLVAIDNLVKGAAGQAVQAANLALGLDEASGLGFPGLSPC